MSRSAVIRARMQQGSAALGGASLVLLALLASAPAAHSAPAFAPQAASSAQQSSRLIPRETLTRAQFVSRMKSLIRSYRAIDASQSLREETTSTTGDGSNDFVATTHLNPDGTFFMTAFGSGETAAYACTGPTRCYFRSEEGIWRKVSRKRDALLNDFSLTTQLLKAGSKGNSKLTAFTQSGTTLTGTGPGLSFTMTPSAEALTVVSIDETDGAKNTGEVVLDRTEAQTVVCAKAPMLSCELKAAGS